MELMEPDGDAMVGISMTNPGPGSVSVKVPAYADDHVSWNEAAATVPAGQQVRFMIYGSDVGCEPDEVASWQGGRMLVDGRPFEVPADDWC
jgi:ferric-dicitrate binding protein FerR (iron transport regulator)